MKVTLDLNHIQLTILHALIGQASDIATSKIVIDEAREYSYTDETIYEVYKRTLAHINNHPTYTPFGEELGDLFRSIDDAMTAVGKNFNKEKEN